jgi:hypothetical protein
MKRIPLLGLATLLSLFTGSAFGAPAKKAPEKKEDAPAAAATITDAEAKEWLTFFDKVVDTMVGAKGDCDKMAKDIEAVTAANKDLLARAQKAQAAGKKLPKSAEEHMGASVQKMMPAMQACGQNPKVQAAMQTMGGKQQ